MRGGVPLARAAAVLHHHALAERALEIIGQQSRGHVHQSARRGGDDEADRFAGTLLRARRADGREREHGKKNPPDHFQAAKPQPTYTLGTGR
jgi:hypothetical protein